MSHVHRILSMIFITTTAPLVFLLTFLQLVLQTWNEPFFEVRTTTESKMQDYDMTKKHGMDINVGEKQNMLGIFF